MTIEKIPSMIELTASHPIRGDRVGEPTSPEGHAVVFVEAMNSVP
ncbi:hypothetical protein [Streptomyces sp. CLCI03]